MLNFLRNNQPFFFILSGCIMLLLAIPIQYINTNPLNEENPLNFFSKLPTLVYYLLFSSLIFFTAFKINRLINKSVLYPKSFYVSGFIYLMLMVLYAPIQFLFLPIISNLLIVLAVGEFFLIFRNENCKNLIFKANLYLFLSALFSPANVFLIPISWFVLFIIRPFVWREYLMPFLVLLLFSIYIIPFGLINGQLETWKELWWSFLSPSSFLSNNIILIIYISFLSLGLFFSINPISTTFIRSNNRYKKITWVIITLLFFTLLISVLSVFLLKLEVPFLFPFFIPMSIIISNGIIRSRFKWILDLLLLLFIVIVLIMHFQ